MPPPNFKIPTTLMHTLCVNAITQHLTLLTTYGKSWNAESFSWARGKRKMTRMVVIILFIVRHFDIKFRASLRSGPLGSLPPDPPFQLGEACLFLAVFNPGQVFALSLSNNFLSPLTYLKAITRLKLLCTRVFQPP